MGAELAELGRKHLVPKDIVFLIDTREQRPLNFSAVPNRSLFRVEPATLTTGDYTIRGLQSEIAVERKSLADLVQCCIGTNRERFEKEIQRMKAFPCRLVVVEASWAEVCQGQWLSKIAPEAVKGSVMRWMGVGIPFHFATSETDAASFVANYMWLHAKSCWERLQAFNNALRVG